MRLRNPGTIDSAVQALTSLKYTCEDCRNIGAVTQARDGYLKWVEDASRQYRNLFTDDGMTDGLHSPAYWQIRRIHEASPRPFPLIHGEVDTQVLRIDAALRDLAGYKEFAGRPGTIVVPDTSALAKGEMFTDLDWARYMGIAGDVRLVIPILVVEELDGLKDRERTTQAGDKARRVLKLLREKCRATEPGVPAQVRRGVTVEVLLDGDWHNRYPIPDAEIIDQALRVQGLVDHQVILTCVDASMEFRARQHGLKVVETPTPETVRAKS